MSGGSHFAPGALCLEPCWHHGLLISWGKTWTKNTVLLLFVTKQGWYSVKKWVGWRYKCHVRAGEIWFAARRNTTFPQIWWYSVLELKLKSRWKEIWNQAETNPIQRFPKFDGLSQPPSTLCGRFQTLCEGKNTQKPIQKWIQMHGRANLSRNATFKHLSLIWGPLKILHHGGRGCGSRLSICQLNIYNKYWDGNAVYTWWPNLELMLEAPSGGQIWN